MVVLAAGCTPLVPFVDAGPGDAGLTAAPVDAGLDAGANVQADAGTSSEDAGLDAGTDAGTDGGASACTPLTFPDRATARVLAEAFIAGMPPLDYAAYGTPNGTMLDALQFEFWWGLDNANPVLPRSTLLSPTSLNGCATCLTYSRQCTGPRNCAGVFLATAGRVTVYRADRDTANGAFIAMAEELEFTAWDRMSDQPIVDAGCYQLARYAFGARWGDAGTVVEAEPWDAGVDACASDEARATGHAGCNRGFATFSDAGADEPGLSCDTETTGPWGTCTDTTFTCVAPPSTTVGTCQRYCGVEASLFSSSTCPSGFRCVRADSRRWFPVPPGTFGVCARDCDATHPCPDGLTCHVTGICL